MLLFTSCTWIQTQYPPKDSLLFIQFMDISIRNEACFPCYSEWPGWWENVWNNWDSEFNIFNLEMNDSEFPKTYVNLVKGKLDPLFLRSVEILISVKVKELF